MLQEHRIYFGADNPQAIDLKKEKEKKSVVGSLTFVQTFIKLFLSIGRKGHHSLCRRMRPEEDTCLSVP